MRRGWIGGTSWYEPGTRAWPSGRTEIERAKTVATLGVAASSSWAAMQAQEQASTFARRPDPTGPQWPALESAAAAISAQAHRTTPTLAKTNARRMATPRAVWNLVTSFQSSRRCGVGSRPDDVSRELCGCGQWGRIPCASAVR